MAAIEAKGDSDSGASATKQQQSKVSSGKETKQVTTTNGAKPKSISGKGMVDDHPASPSAPVDDRYHHWGKNGAAPSDSLRSLEAREMPMQKVSTIQAKGKVSAPEPGVDEILDQIYLRQYHHALSDSCSSGSYTGESAPKRQSTGHQKFGPYATRETLKRSVFYGACCSAVILLSIFVFGMAVGFPLIFVKLKNLDERIAKCGK